MTSPAHLRAWLGTLDAEELATLLEIRPDTLHGAPLRNLEDLAERLVHPASVTPVLTDLPTPLVQVLETLAACGDGASIRRAAELLNSSSAGSGGLTHLELVARCVDYLRRAALVWPTRAPGAAQNPDAGAKSLRHDGSGDDGSFDSATPLAVNPGVLALVPDPLRLGRPVASIAADMPVDSLKRVVKGWGLSVPARKDELVRVVEAYLANPNRVRALVARAPSPVPQVLLDRARDLAQPIRCARAAPSMLGELTGDEPAGAPAAPGNPQTHRAGQIAMTWARDHGLAFSRFGDLPAYAAFALELPSEVVLALLGVDAALPFDPAPPQLPTVPVTAGQVRSSASGAITDTLALTMAVLETVDRHPLTALKSGGIGARELARLAKAFGAQPGDVRLALELISRLRLLDWQSDGRMGTSARFAQWRRLEPAERASALVVAWLGAGLVPTLDRDSDGRIVPALFSRDLSGRAQLVRRLTLDQLQSLTETGVTASGPLADLAAWRLPYLAGRRIREEAGATWAEGHKLGVLALGALSEPGRALLGANPAEALPAMFAGMLPATQASALFGSDLTVVVLGSPAPAVVDLLDSVAVREARGSAATWRFTPESVRHALDDGHDADDLVAGLRALTDAELPQGLEYLVRDVARRHGHVRVQAVGSVVVGEDPALLAEIAAHRGLRKAGLRQVAPTVLVATGEAKDVIRSLRDAGYLPVPMDVHGERVITVVPGVEIRTSEPDADNEDDADTALRLWVADMARSRAETPAAAAGRLLRGEDPPEADAHGDLEFDIARLARRLSVSEVRQLAHAISHGDPVQIQYRSSSGGASVRTVSELHVRGGYLYGWCHLQQDERYFPLASIIGVAPA